MKVLVVGSGGREHALCWALAASPLVERARVRPGQCRHRGGGPLRPGARPTTSTGWWPWRGRRALGLVVVGPEVPLVLGLVDRLSAAGIKAFGPTAAAARLEGSKAFTKAFCGRHGIPTAAYRAFGPGERAAARDYVEAQGAPIVVKADGLAAGKGVVVAATVAEALAAVDGAYEGARRSSSRRSSTARRPACSRCATGRRRWRSAPRRTTSGRSTATWGRTLAGMGAYSPAPRLDAGHGRAGDGGDRAADAGGDGGGRRAVHRHPLCRADADGGTGRS